MVHTAHRGDRKAVNWLVAIDIRGQVMRSYSLGSIVRVERKGKKSLHQSWLIHSVGADTGLGEARESNMTPRQDREEKPSRGHLSGFTHCLLPVSPSCFRSFWPVCFPLEHGSTKYLCSIMSWQSLLPSKFISWELLLRRKVLFLGCLHFNNFEAFEN